jgi:hypothetical protein
MQLAHKYSWIERERRLLLAELPSNADASRIRRITVPHATLLWGRQPLKQSFITTTVHPRWFGAKIWQSRLQHRTKF